MSARESLKVWVVVVVLSGVSALAEVFRHEQVAEKRLSEVRIDLRPEYDEAAIFEAEIQE